MGKKHRAVYWGNLWLRGAVFAGVFGISILTAVIVGGIQRRTYTDIAAEENPMRHFQVAPFPDELIEVIGRESYLDIFEECEYVLKIRAAGGAEFNYLQWTQKAVVEQVFRGDGLSEGDTVIVRRGPCFRDTDQEFLLNTGFCNVLTEGETYLIYCDKVDALDPEEKVIADPGTITMAVFSYTDHENTVSGEFVYVPYESVKNNEFFAQTKEGMEALEDWKERMMEPYR